MKISEILKEKKITVSFEMFPPKEWSGLSETKKIAGYMSFYKPDFMSVTCGAGGGNRDFTISIASEIENTLHISALAHCTAISTSNEKLDHLLSSLKENNINNILALRGDIPTEPGFIPSKDFLHAGDLIKAIKEKGDFCVGGACYPEKHPESESKEKDLEYLRLKQDCGADFLTSQLFFDNAVFYSFLEKSRAKGITIPILPGIMPVTNARQINRIVSLSGTALPKKFLTILEHFGNSPLAMRQAGIAFATEQIIDLIANGCNNIHIYTMNKPEVAGAILINISDIIKI